MNPLYPLVILFVITSVLIINVLHLYAKVLRLEREVSRFKKRVEKTPERSQSADKGTDVEKWIKENGKTWAGKTVALRDGKVVASGLTPMCLRSTLESMGYSCTGFNIIDVPVHIIMEPMYKEQP